MDFLVFHEEDAPSDSISVLLQGEKDTTIFYIQLPHKQDTCGDWLALLKRFYVMAEENPEREQFSLLLKTIPLPPGTLISEDAYPTYLNMLQAILNLLSWAKTFQKEHPACEDVDQRYPLLYSQLEDSLFQFDIQSQQNNKHTVAFTQLEQTTWQILLQFENDTYLTEVSQANLEASCSSEEGKLYVTFLVENYISFQSVLARQMQGAVLPGPDSPERKTTLTLKMQAFSSLSKALINLIDQDIAGLRIYISLIPLICAFIIKNELEDIEVQQFYLERLLKSRESLMVKRQRLIDIVKDIKNDMLNQRLAHSVKQRKDEDERLRQVISLISNYYLKQYDLTTSADFWDMVEKKGFMLCFLLLLHRKSWIYLGMLGLALSALLLFSYRHWSMPAHFFPLDIGKLVDYVPFGIITVIYVVFLIFLFGTLFEIVRKHKKWLYSQLLLPRLLGAVVVGLLTLLFSAEPWHIGIESSILSLFLLFSFTCLGSFAYMFIEVNSTMKLFHGRSLQKALGVSLQLFLIAFTETLFVVSIISALIFPALSSELAISDLSDKPGVTLNIGGWIPPLTFFPLQIFLWTGIALFIGSFVQLLWQDRRITDPI